MSAQLDQLQMSFWHILADCDLPVSSFIFHGCLTLIYNLSMFLDLDDFDETSIEPYMDNGRITIPQGKTTKILCVPPNGYPTPKAYWTKNGNVLSETTRPR